MVALDDMTSNIPDLVVPEGNDEVSEQATGYVNAVYFTNWYA
jgi:chitinase